MVESDIRIVEDHLRRVNASLSLHKSITENFSRSSDGGLSRSPNGANSSRTGSAFALYVLSKAGFSGKQLPGKPGAFLSYLEALGSTHLGAITRAQSDLSAPLNEYSVPIWLCGVLTAHAMQRKAPSASMLHQAQTAVGSIISELSLSGGCLRRVGAAAGEMAPSAYLTYWAACALVLAKTSFKQDGELVQKIEQAMSSAAQWAELELSRLIANHHAGILSRFDVVECISAACTVSLLREEQAPRLTDESRQLSTYGVCLVLDSYFVAGSFRLSRPVFADNRHNAILCPTSEALFMVLSSFTQREKIAIFSGPRLESLMQTFDWCRRSAKEKGFPPDYDVSLGGGAEVNVFSTASTIGFFSMLGALLDELLDDLARDALGVQSEPPRSGFGYPRAFEKSVKEQVIAPLSEGGRLERAKYSLVLYGPPGTAKTSFAAQLAFDLGWPLKVVTQSDFMRRGESMIDAEAERVFYLCSQLKRVVLLFDELEELILARHSTEAKTDKVSRLLTTSMLPKIHELRDRKRVVFMFATNRLSSIDPAVTRLGRFDLRYGIDYPDEASLKATAQGAFESLARGEPENIVNNVKKSLKRGLIEEYMSRPNKAQRPLMTFKDVAYVVENMFRRAQSNEEAPKLERQDILMHALSEIDIIDQTNNNQEYKLFVDARRESDRL
jgi:ATPase family associated with various cellular activities (AAA)